MRAVFLSLIILLVSSFAFAQSGDDVETRAREVGRSLRCVVCQNQSIEDSDAILAADMRKIVRQRLSEGQSNAQVIEYMRDNYGDYVLLKPPVQGNTYILWFAPFALLALALIWLALPKRPAVISASELSDEERAKLGALFDKDRS